MLFDIGSFPVCFETNQWTLSDAIWVWEWSCEWNQAETLHSACVGVCLFNRLTNCYEGNSLILDSESETINVVQVLGDLASGMQRPSQCLLQHEYQEGDSM